MKFRIVIIALIVGCGPYTTEGVVVKKVTYGGELLPKIQERAYMDRDGRTIIVDEIHLAPAKSVTDIWLSNGEMITFGGKCEEIKVGDHIKFKDVLKRAR